MNQFKPIISHQEGQNLFPGIPTVIKGDKAATHITMKNTKPQIAITPYGASYMSPGQDYAFAGNTVVELPTAQMGGQEEDSEAQIMQILQIYAQMKQIPIQQLIQQIQNLSEEEQQQSITAIAQEVQQVMQEQQQQQMAQQQMPMGQEEMGMAEEEMPMAQAGQEKRTEYMEKNPQGYYDYYKSTNTPEGPRYYKGTSPNMSFAQTMANFKAANNPADSTVYSTMPPNVQAAFKEDGGELCFDCYDHYNPFPQAQNLNWFYKAQGGEAFPQAQNLNWFYKAQDGGERFPQANPYPHMYADGGEAFPQAQTYLPYNRGNKPKPNFMFLEGGTTDIDQAYQVMKRGGMDFNPKKKRGGKFTQDSFQEYVMKNGGYLPKHQYDGITMSSSEKPVFDYYEMPAYNWDQMLEFVVSPDDNIITDYFSSMSEDAPNAFPKGTVYDQKTNSLISPDKFKQDNLDIDPFSDYVRQSTVNANASAMLARAIKDRELYKKQKSNSNTTSNYVLTGDVATPAASESTNWRDVYRQSQKKMRQNNRGTAVRYPGQTQFLKASVGTTPRRSNVLGPALGAALRAADFGSGMTTGREIFGRNGGSMPLPKHQFTTATVGQNLSQPSGSYNTWGSPTIPAAVSESPAFQQMQDYNANATRIADQNVVSQGTDKLGDKPYSANSKRGFGFNTPYAARMVSNLEGIGNFLTGINELKAEDKIREKMPLSSAWMPVQQSTDRGDYMTNTGMFRPDDYTYARSSPGMQSDQAFYAQTGGPLDMFEDGGVYDLDENTINMILAMGGSVEYL